MLRRDNFLSYSTCRADPAQTYSPSPEKQHFFHMVLLTRSCSFWSGSGSRSPSFIDNTCDVLWTKLTIEFMLIEYKYIQRCPRPVNSDNSVCGVDEEGLAPPGKLDALDRRRRADLYGTLEVAYVQPKRAGKISFDPNISDCKDMLPVA